MLIILARKNNGLSIKTSSYHPLNIPIYGQVDTALELI